MSVLVNGEIILTGFVGESFWGEGFTHREVLDALTEVGRNTDVNVFLNSGGGYVDDGKGIYNAFAAHKGKVTIYVEGIAASAASIIAMAGDEIIMRKGATMMIHDPLTFTYGNSADHQKSVEMLEVEATNLAGIYADRSGKTDEECREIMEEETWYTAEDAVAAGFADKAEKGKAKALASFDYSLYEHAPAEALTLAKNRKWNLHDAMQAKKAKQGKAVSSAATTTPKPKEPSMTEKSKADEGSTVDTAKIVADAAKAAQDRIAAILSCDEAKGRDEQAKHLAFKTQISAEDAKAILAAGGKSGAVEEQPDGEKPNTEASYAQRKAENGGDRLAGNEPDKGKAGASSWGSIVSRLNGRAA